MVLTTHRRNRPNADAKAPRVYSKDCVRDAAAVISLYEEGGWKLVTRVRTFYTYATQSGSDKFCEAVFGKRLCGLCDEIKDVVTNVLDNDRHDASRVPTPTKFTFLSRG